MTITKKRVISILLVFALVLASISGMSFLTATESKAWDVTPREQCASRDNTSLEIVKEILPKVLFPMTDKQHYRDYVEIHMNLKSKDNIRLFIDNQRVANNHFVVYGAKEYTLYGNNKLYQLSIGVAPQFYIQDSTTMSLIKIEAHPTSGPALMTGVNVKWLPA